MVVAFVRTSSQKVGAREIGRERCTATRSCYRIELEEALWEVNGEEGKGVEEVNEPHSMV